MASEPEEILSILNGMSEETKALKKELANIQWHMKMGVADAYVLSPKDRKLYAEVISENAEKFAKVSW